MQADYQNTKIFDAIAGAQNILLLTDERIDGDTTGSTLAMFHWLKSIGKNVRVFSPKSWPEEYRFLPGAELVSFDPSIINQPTDLALIFDCSDGKYLQPFALTAPLIVFDHHATNLMYGKVNQVLVEASSTGEVVWRFFKANRIPITRDMATCLMMAICTDTTLFTNPSTSQVCMEAAAELGMAGAKVHDVVKHVYKNKSVEQLKAWGLALERLTELPGKILITCLLAKDRVAAGVTEIDTSAISNFLIGMAADAKMIVVFSEKDDGSVKASMRTLDGDVAAIAKRHGGGGHVKAAGFSVEQSRLEEGPFGWRVTRADGTYFPIAELLKA